MLAIPKCSIEWIEGGINQRLSIPRRMQLPLGWVAVYCKLRRCGLKLFTHASQDHAELFCGIAAGMVASGYIARLRPVLTNDLVLFSSV